MASTTLEAMASHLGALASTLEAMASHLVAAGLQPTSDGLLSISNSQISDIHTEVAFPRAR